MINNYGIWNNSNIQSNSFGLACLVNHYIFVFTSEHLKYDFNADDKNTGMKGHPLLVFMLRNKFSDLYDNLDDNDKNLFKNFIFKRIQIIQDNKEIIFKSDKKTKKNSEYR